MRHDVDFRRRRFYGTDGIFIVDVSVAAVYESSGHLVRCLEAELQLDEALLADFRDSSENVGSEAVWAGRNGDSNHPIARQGLPVFFLKLVRISVSRSEILEIGDEFPITPSTPPRQFRQDLSLSALYLLFYGKISVRGEVAGAAPAAEDAAADSLASVPVRTGASGVDCHFVDLAAKNRLVEFRKPNQLNLQKTKKRRPAGQLANLLKHF